MTRTLFLTWLIAILIALPGLATAQDALPSTPTDGMTMPYESVATQSDASSLEVNPAGLGFMNTVEIGYGFEIPSDELREIENESQGFFLGWGNEYLGLGFAAQFLDRPDLGRDRDSFRKYTFGFAFANPRTFSVGANVNWFGSDYNERLNDMVSWDLGMQWRLGEYVGLGAVFRDLNAPFLFDDVSLPRRIATAVTLRMFQGRLMLDNSFEFVARTDDWTWTPRLFVEPIHGIRVFGQSTFLVDETTETQLEFSRFWAGLEFALDGIGAAYAPFFAENLDGDIDYRGLTAYHWISPNKTNGLLDFSGRWIQINLNTSIDESGSSLGFFGPNARSFLSVVNELDRIAASSEVEGVVLVAGQTSFGYAQSWEIRQAIQRLKQSGKTTVTYLTTPTLRDYYIASASDHVWGFPTEPFSPTGISIRLASYKGALNKIGVEAEFVRIGDYKTAVEPFVYEGPSKASIEQTSVIADQLYGDVVKDIAAGRGKTQAQIEELFAQTPHFPTEAKKKGLYDDVLYPDELQDKLKALLGRPIYLEEGYNPVKRNEERWGARDEIAVIVIEGNIISGASGFTPFSATGTGGQTIAKVCEQLANDSTVKAVVVRVNSPGGSAVASDQIFRSLRLLSRKKPVVASMSNVAASGGYYSAVGATEIFAPPNTITGSIGIFSGRFNAAGLLNWLDIKGGEKIVRGTESTDVFEPWTEAERERVSLNILYRYRTFLHQVASTRPMSAEEIDAVARGRVWTGRDAKTQSLVDKEGGLIDAIRRAEQLANIPAGSANYALYPEVVGFGSMGSGTWVKAGEFLGLIPSQDVEFVKQVSTLKTLFGRFERSFLLPLMYRSDEALMLPYNDIIIE